MSKINFSKISGAGNDFILVDRNKNHDLAITEELIRTICKRRIGVGADGLIEIFDHDSCDFGMNYFNSDGSTGTLCGNGARCAIHYGFLSGRAENNTAKFDCHGEYFEGIKLDDQNIQFSLQQPKDINLDVSLDQKIDLDYEASFADTGSPHLVIDITKSSLNIDELNVLEIGAKLRNAEQFQPEGLNVNFIEIVDENIFIRTYERGVEDETLACGTGSVASSLIAFLNYKLKTPINLVVRSGDQLKVKFDYKDNKFENVELIGPAKVIFEGVYELK